MIWVLALAAAALCIPGTSQKPTALLILITTAITQLEFPIAFGGVVPGHLWGTFVLMSRNLLLVAATLVSMRRLWRATVTPPATTTPEAATSELDSASPADPSVSPLSGRPDADPVESAESGTLRVSGQGG
jgi:hypothetical protein